jgi:hypothetical protein
VAAVAIAVLVGGCAARAATPSGAVTNPLAVRTITATGQGTAQGTPDLLTVILGVQTSGPHLSSTLAMNNAEAQAIISKIEADGVAGKDLQTSQLSIGPNYVQPTPASPPKLTGYTVSDLLTAKIRHLDKGGAIIDDAMSAGGNDAQVQSIAYSVENDGPLQSAARASAVTQARAEAMTMAAAAGVTVGSVRTVTDLSQQSYNNAYPVLGSPAGGATASAGVPAPPVQPGTQVISMQVAVTFDLS